MRLLLPSVLFLFLMMSFSITVIPSADASYDDPWCATTRPEPFPPDSGGGIVANDPIVKMFLEKNPEIRLSDAEVWSNSAGVPLHFWRISENRGSYPGLFLALDYCPSIATYDYAATENDTSARAHYQNNNNVMAAITGEEFLCENHNDKEYPKSYVGEEHVRNDLLVRGFLAANPDIQFSGEEYVTVNDDLHVIQGKGLMYKANSAAHVTVNDDLYAQTYSHTYVSSQQAAHVTVNDDLYAPYFWKIGDWDHSDTPRLRIELDRCFNVAYFGYVHLENSPLVFQGIYEENYHEVLQAITGKPFTPYVQAAFYEIPIRDVQCNGEENSLYIRDDTRPMCLKPTTYESLLQRGYGLEKVQQADLEVNSVS